MRLHFVQWDRFVNLVETDQMIKLYGWIPREDGKNDYIQLEYYTKDHPIYEDFGFTTSSKKYTREISKILQGTDENHADCERIEEKFPQLENVIHLKK